MLQRHRGVGFSLAEIVIVMGIMAVLVAVSVPFYLRWRSNQELRNSADRVLSAIRVTQSLAMRFSQHPSEFEIPLAGGESLQEVMTGVAPDPFSQCSSLGEVVGGDPEGGTTGDLGGTSGGTSGTSGVTPIVDHGGMGTTSSSSGGGSSSSSSGGTSGSSSGTSGAGGSNAGSPAGGSNANAATVCSIALKKSDTWTVYSKEYVDGGITVSLSPTVSFTDANVDANAQSAISVGGARGIAFLSNGTLYSRAQTQLQLTSSTGRTCVIVITPNGGVTMQQ